MTSGFPKVGRAASLPPTSGPRLDRAKLRFLSADEAGLSVAFETSLLGFADTSTSVDPEEEEGSHRARGRLTEVSPGRIVLANSYGDLLQIRLRVPALDLSPLVGSTLSVQLSHRPGPGRTTIDAVFRDSRGALVLWARDGAVPGGRGAMGVTVRLARDSSEPVLEVSGRTGTLQLRPGTSGDAAIGLTPVVFAALRVGASDASFFAVRL